MSDKTPVSHIILAVFGDDLTNPGGSDPDGDEVQDPVQKFLADAELRKLLGKPAPARVTPSAASSDEFVKRSDARFAKVAAKIREVFGPEHLEECEEAIALADKMRTAARAEVLALAEEDF